MIEEFCTHGKESTRTPNQRATASKNFDLLRNKKLVETSADDLQSVLKTMATFNNHILRCVHNLALGLGWFHRPIIPPKLWPQPKEKEKRAIIQEEHGRVLQSEQDWERRLYHELLWETGASQSDAALKRAENIDWNNRPWRTNSWSSVRSVTMNVRQRMVQPASSTPPPVFFSLRQLDFTIVAILDRKITI